MQLNIGSTIKSVFREHFRIHFEQLTLANVWAVPEAAGELDFS